MRFVPFISAVLVSAGALTACTSTAKTAAPALTAADYLQQADAICKADTATIVAAAVALGDSPTVQQQQQWVTATVVPLYSHTVSAVGALTPPKELAAKVSTWLTVFKRAIGEAKASPASVLDGSGSLPTAYNRAAEVGLQECNQQPKK